MIYSEELFLAEIKVIPNERVQWHNGVALLGKKPKPQSRKAVGLGRTTSTTVMGAVVLFVADELVRHNMYVK